MKLKGKAAPQSAPVSSYRITTEYPLVAILLLRGTALGQPASIAREELKKDFATMPRSAVEKLAEEVAGWMGMHNYKERHADVLPFLLSLHKEALARQGQKVL